MGFHISILWEPYFYPKSDVFSCEKNQLLPQPHLDVNSGKEEQQNKGKKKRKYPEKN